MDEKLQDMKGRGKEALGDLTENRDLEREGKIDQGEASVKDKIGKVGGKLKDAIKRD
jgi:uncharacterized protein YjbJ (UPF0337 family)